MREERARVKADPDVTDGARAELLKRLDGIAQILAKTAARDTSLIALLEPRCPVTTAAQTLRRDLLLEAGAELSPDELIITREPEVRPELGEKQVVPASVRSRQLANPFLAPDFSAAAGARGAGAPPRQLGAASGRCSARSRSARAARRRAWTCRRRRPLDRLAPRGLELMKHQARFVEAARLGHRTFLLADEPGLGKTAQSLLAASVSDAYPLLAVVPNVVKMNWAREVERWTPQRTATVIHGDGDDLDAFADVVIVNYDVLDRHVGWLSTLGFKGMVVDEAHFIKNLQSQRSQATCSRSPTASGAAPRAATRCCSRSPARRSSTTSTTSARSGSSSAGSRATKPLARAACGMLEETGLTPADPGFFTEARRTVIDIGIVRRSKVDVAADLPARRIADLPVELDDELGRSIRAAERELGNRLVGRFRALVEARYLRVGDLDDDQRDQYIRAVASAELEESKSAKTGENVFTMVRKIGQAKAGLAADYAAQLARSVGKVVFFAKHIDVMDQAEAALAARELRTVSIRGDQTATAAPGARSTRSTRIPRSRSRSAR